MKKSKKNAVSCPRKCLDCNRVNWNDPLIPLPSAENCLRCFSNFFAMISETSAEYVVLPIDQKIAFLKDIIANLRLVLTLFSQNCTDFFEKKLEIEIMLRDQMIKNNEKTESTPSVTELLALLGLKQIRVNGTMFEIGKKVGEFFFHCVDAKKKQMFDIDAIAIAKLISVLFVLPAGKKFNLHTLEGYVGQGRKGDQNEGK